MVGIKTFNTSVLLSITYLVWYYFWWKLVRCSKDVSNEKEGSQADHKASFQWFLPRTLHKPEILPFPSLKLHVKIMSSFWPVEFKSLLKKNHNHNNFTRNSNILQYPIHCAIFLKKPSRIFLFNTVEQFTKLH